MQQLHYGHFEYILVENKFGKIRCISKMHHPFRDLPMICISLIWSFLGKTPYYGRTMMCVVLFCCWPFVFSPVQQSIFGQYCLMTRQKMRYSARQNASRFFIYNLLLYRTGQISNPCWSRTLTPKSLSGCSKQEKTLNK